MSGCSLCTGVLSKTLSHMWDKLNSPIFLFKVGLLTPNKYGFFNISSYAMPLPPYYLEVLFGGGITCVTAMMMYRGRILQVFFESFTKGPGGFPYVFIIRGKVTTQEPVYGPTFVDHGVFVLGETSRFLMVLLPLKWICIPYFPQIFLMLLQRPWVYGMTM